MRVPRYVLALSTGALLAAAPAPAHAATFYVGGAAASDANAGTAAKPWATLTRAMKAPDGSVVLARPGRYAPIRATAVRHPTAPVTIQRADYASGENPMTLAATRKVTIGTPAAGGQNTMANVSGITFRGLHLNGTTVVTGAERLHILDSEIGPTASFGLFFQKGAGTWSLRNSSIVRNWFHDSNQIQRTAGIQRTTGHMIVLSAGSGQSNTDISVKRNRFDNIVDGDALQISGAARVDFASNLVNTGRVGESRDHVDALQVLAPVTDMTIRRNRVGNGIRGFIVQQKSKKVCITSLCTAGVELRDWRFAEYYSGVLARLQIENNIVMGPDFSMRLMGAADTQVVNNTFWGTTYNGRNYGVRIRGAVTGDPRKGKENVTFANNVARDLDVDALANVTARTRNITIYNWGVAGVADLLGARFAPLFSGLLGELSVEDPNARDQARPEYAPAVDHNGMVREDGDPDIGASEAGATTPGEDPGPAGFVAPAASPDEPTATLSGVRFASQVRPRRARAHLAISYKICGKRTSCRRKASRRLSPKLRFTAAKRMRVTVTMRHCKARKTRCTGKAVAVSVWAAQGRNIAAVHAALKLRQKGWHRISVRPRAGGATRSVYFRVR